jgi:hypothetical protein
MMQTEMAAVQKYTAKVTCRARRAETRLTARIAILQRKNTKLELNAVAIRAHAMSASAGQVERLERSSDHQRSQIQSLQDDLYASHERQQMVAQQNQMLTDELAALRSLRGWSISTQISGSSSSSTDPPSAVLQPRVTDTQPTRLELPTSALHEASSPNRVLLSMPRR